MSVADDFLRHRRDALARHPRLLGLDYLDVTALGGGLYRLALHFIPDESPTAGGGAGKNAALAGLAAANLRFFSDGAAVDGLFAVRSLAWDGAATVTVEASFAGDTDLARRLGQTPNFTLELAGFPDVDPFFSRLDFALDPGAALPADPAAAPATAPMPALPSGSYLAKDYASFRQRMLDRLAQTLPDWDERNPADLLVTLVELLADAADQASYFQDAVATEAYLGTARLRTSVRRHARLAGYPLHEGNNARTWVQVDATADNALLPAGTPLLTRVDGVGTALLAPGSAALAQAMAGEPIVFETLADRTVWTAHDEIPLYDWGAESYVLPAGATGAVLVGRLPHLAAGDVLIFEEVKDPASGLAEEAHPEHRAAVRLTLRQGTEDLLATALPPAPAGTGTLASTGTAVTGTGTAFTTNLAPGDVLTARDEVRRVLAVTDDSRLTLDAPFVPNLPAGTPFTLGRLTEIAWQAEDALPFALEMARASDDPTAPPVRGISVARGNVVLADHGWTVGVAPPETLVATAGRFRPRLAQPGLTYRETLGDPSTESPPSATAALAQDVATALPVLTLSEGSRTWNLRRDLFASDRFASDFVVETEDDGSAVLRFGDGVLGAPPAPGAVLTAVYRVGNGTAGNLGRDSLYHVVTSAGGIAGVRNPLPAAGGRDPEPIAKVRYAAPGALRNAEREPLTQRVVELAESHPEVERAAVALTWTGSWHRLEVAVQRKGGLPVDDAFAAALATFLDEARLAGWELVVRPLEQVGLDIALTALLGPDAFRGTVERSLDDAFSNRELPDGRLGFFHPSHLGFGQPVYLSQIIAAALAVPGVRAIDSDETVPKPNRFRRYGQPSRGELAAGQIRLSGVEIARVDNDPAAPQNGRIRFFLEGGQ